MKTMFSSVTWSLIFTLVACSDDSSDNALPERLDQYESKSEIEHLADEQESAPFDGSLYIIGGAVAWRVNQDAKFDYIGDDLYRLNFALDVGEHQLMVSDGRGSTGLNLGAGDALKLNIPTLLTTEQNYVTFEVANPRVYQFVIDATDIDAPLLTVSLAPTDIDAPFGGSITLDGLSDAELYYQGDNFYKSELSLTAGEYVVRLKADQSSIDALQLSDNLTYEQLTQTVSFSAAEYGFYSLTLDAKEPNKPLLSLEHKGKGAKVTIHYQRCNNDYEGWEVHFWGDAVRKSQITKWAKDPEFTLAGKQTEYGYALTFDVTFDIQPFEFLIHQNGNKDVSVDRSLIPADTPEIWVREGDEEVYSEEPTTDNSSCN